MAGRTKPQETFTCEGSLRAALDGRAAETGLSKAEVIRIALAKDLGVEYTPLTVGRPKK